MSLTTHKSGPYVELEPVLTLMPEVPNFIIEGTWDEESQILTYCFFFRDDPDSGCVVFGEDTEAVTMLAVSHFKRIKKTYPHFTHANRFIGLESKTAIGLNELFSYKSL